MTAGSARAPMPRTAAATMSIGCALLFLGITASIWLGDWRYAATGVVALVACVGIAAGVAVRGNTRVDVAP